MKKIVALAPAKLNLTFDIIGRLADGYHELATLFHAIDLEDKLTFHIEPSESLSIDLALLPTFNGAEGKDVAGIDDFPLDERNLIFRAVRLLLDTANGAQPLSIRVEVDKRIPIGAGLAGGSSDAAAALRAINRHLGEKLAEPELAVLGKQLGADVPFCLVGGTCEGYGRGEILKRVEHEVQYTFLLIKPKNLSIATREAYRWFDEHQGEVRRPLLNSCVASLCSGDAERAATLFGNVFEPVVMLKEGWAVGRIKLLALQSGALACHMTGSGPAFFAVVEESNAEKVRAELRDWDKDLDIWLVRSSKYGARVVQEVEDG